LRRRAGKRVDSATSGMHRAVKRNAVCCRASYNGPMKKDELLANRNVQFWCLQIAGWTGWGVSLYVGALFWDVPDLYARYVPIVTIIGLVLSLGLRHIYKETWDRPPLQRFVILIGSSWLAAAIWMTCRSNIFMAMFDKPDKHEGDFWSTLYRHIDGVSTAWLVMLCWTGLYFGIKYYQLLQVERERGLKNQAMAHEAQLKMLRYQLNPHFLFNTLNAISTLILDKDNQLANTMVTHLSRFLRYSLDNDPMQKISLAQELQALQLYLDIEKVRFDERLKMEFNVERAAEQAMIPSLLLQPLVENAIKYAIAQAVHGGTISVNARVFAGELLLEVVDDGPGTELTIDYASGGNGVGLANTRERLRELYGDNQSFRLGRTDPHGLTVSIRIPLEIEDAD
jgi:two-component system LytT family sensor kinase